jgi:hypothetical protein
MNLSTDIGNPTNILRNPKIRSSNTRAKLAVLILAGYC